MNRIFIFFNQAMGKITNIFNYLLLIAITIITASCATPLPEAPMQPIEQRVFSHLALGDSYTIGEGIEQKDRWSVQLSDISKQKGVIIQENQIIARTGWTAGELSNNIRSANLNKTFSMVSLMIGVNNQYRGQTTDQFRSEFQTVLQQAVELTDNKPENILLFSIPDWGVTPYAAQMNINKDKISQEIDEFNKVIKEEGQKYGIDVLNITDVSRQAAADNSLLADDNLHYSGKMYRIWADMALPKTLNILN